MTTQKGGLETLKSEWLTETRAMLKKELLTELRGKNGLFATLLFAFGSVTAIGLAAARGEPSPTLAAGMFWVALLFAAVSGLLRTFLLEEETGTADLLRLWANPSPVFWGKFFFNLLLQIAVCLLITPLFILFVGSTITDWPLLIATLLIGSIALTAAVSICGAIACRAQGKAMVAGVISLPVLFPVLLMGISALRVALGAPVSGGWQALAGCAGLALVFCAVGPYLYAAIWKQ